MHRWRRARPDARRPRWTGQLPCIRGRNRYGPRQARTANAPVSRWPRSRRCRGRTGRSPASPSRRPWHFPTQVVGNELPPSSARSRQATSPGVESTPRRPSKTGGRTVTSTGSGRCPEGSGCPRGGTRVRTGRGAGLDQVGLVKTERREDALPQYLPQRHAGHVLHDQPQREVVAAVVLPPCPRREEARRVHASSASCSRWPSSKRCAGSRRYGSKNSTRSPAKSSEGRSCGSGAGGW